MYRDPSTGKCILPANNQCREWKPCKNDGHCIDSEQGYSCKCKSGQ